MSNQKLRINLNGPEGNAFALLGIAKNLARQVGKNPEEISKEMMGGDYEHLVNTMTKHLGEYIEIIK